MTDARDWFSRAQAEGFAIGAFNVSNLEMFRAVVGAAVATRGPVLIESSDGETEFIGARTLVALVGAAREETGLPIFLNLDHSRSPEAAEEAIDYGYDFIHYDGSKEETAENIRNLRRVVRSAHRAGALVEGELDYIIEGSEKRSISAAQGLAKSHLTNPAAAATFVERTGIDTFAVSIGNVHGIYTTDKKLDIHLLHEIRSRVGCFLSLHGGSTISPAQIRRAIEVGRIVKVNVSSELRQAYRSELEEVLKNNPSELAMYKLMPPVIERIQKIVETKIRMFGSANKV